MIINIGIVAKHPTVEGAPVIVCGNSDYQIQFTFDSEWDELNAKTARFVFVQNSAVKYIDQAFLGDLVEVPVLANTREVRIGVFSGDLRTTTPARIPCEPSIRCGTAAPEEVTPEQYDQIMALMNDLSGGVANAVNFTEQTLTPEQQAQARANIGAIAQDGINDAVNAGLSLAKESGEFEGDPGQDGASAYEIWLLQGNTGTEEDFLASLKGADGKDGLDGKDGASAYEIWLAAGNTGTEEDFLASLKADVGESGGTGGGSGSSSVIEVPTTVSWSTNPTPTVTFDLSYGNITYRFYKIADITPTKEQILSAQWSISDYAGSVMYDHTVDATEIAVDTAELLQLQFSTDPGFAYGILYATGDLAIDADGTILNVTVPETGLYQIWTAGKTFLTTMTGSITYKTSMELPFVQSDWHQNDITAEGYIRNRPFYEKSAVLNFLPSAELTFVYSEDDGATVYDTTPSAEQLSMWSSDWDSAVVIWDGVEYICQPKTAEGAKYIGNAIVFGLTDTGEPFSIICADASIAGANIFWMFDFSASADTTHTVQILINGAEVHKLDSKFISDIDYEKQVINKPFGVLSANTVVVNEDVSLVLDTVATDTTPAVFIVTGTQVNSKALIPGANYTVTIDALSFTGVCKFDDGYKISDGTTYFFANDAAWMLNIQSNDYTDGQTVSVSVVLAEDAIKKIDAEYIPSEAVPTSVDLSAYESSGTIVETYADGTTKTTSIEFDADGNPIKITDADGNVTELTW